MSYIFEFNYEDTTIEENKIDKMVYELYGLTEDEIKIVKNSIRNWILDN